MELQKEFVVIISGPSGVGKSTIVEILKKEPIFYYSVSVTTREPRPGEKNGVDYWFVSGREFEKMIENGELLEWAKVHTNYYGTPKRYLEESAREGKVLLMDLDVQGALKVKAMKPSTILIFIAPPSWEELRRRLAKRGTENEDELAIRLSNAKEEIKMAVYYDYVVVNDDSTKCAEQIMNIIKIEKMRPRRNEFLFKLIEDGMS